MDGVANDMDISDETIDFLLQIRSKTPIRVSSRVLALPSGSG
ncbi:hypothetical protein [Microtetraspora niveoalba]|nr:hypothetical protein [Microtetraspora niveoalba]